MMAGDRLCRAARRAYGRRGRERAARRIEGAPIERFAETWVIITIG